uniref:TRPM SLOG domain-containing protein n=1 Tax=Gouania willdenowi TaxID=441366 RepID=A0A8C5EES7_GOUWI
VQFRSSRATIQHVLDVCKCGYLKDQHADNAIKPEDFTGESWNRLRHIQEVPTDAFGDISFGGLGQKTGKYVRVSTDTRPEDLYHLLTDKWKLSPPNLLISVTGGAKNFFLKARLKTMFHRGLIKVAQTTGAWILTGGTHAGVMKHVGQAVRDYALGSSMQGNIVAIGVATWGVIHNRQALVHPEGSFPAHYEVDTKGQGRLSCLNNNHTHFLLVDDGTHGHYGVEIELRSRLEKCISGKRLGNIDTVSGFNIHSLLLPASRSSEFLGMESWKRQLELAISWNRVDIAETEIFTEESQWKSSDLHWAMFSALVGNRPQFVSLLLENGVKLRDFLQDEETLCELYKQLPACFFLRKLAKRVHNALRGKRKPFGKRSRRGQGQTISLTFVSEEVRHLLGRDLFLWAIVQNNKLVAEIAWEQCSDCMTAALGASKILKSMAEEGGDADEAESMQELASYYEKCAIGVFSECHNSDEERAQKLLVRVSPLWGRTTCLRLALEADNKNFVAQSGVQALLTQIWCGELSVDNPVWRVLLCMLLFPLIYTGFLVLKRLKPLGNWSKLVCLYNSPQVKFYWNIVFYFAFLFLFAVVLMMDFQTSPSAGELLLYIWIFSLVCEEVRQLFHDPDGFGFRKKLRDDTLDQFLLSYLRIMRFSTFRLTPWLFYAGKVVLCIDFVVFCLRLMAIFTISKTLGPKIIIVRRMITDMFFFMFLLSIWVVAYGVAKQGILIDNDVRLDWIVRGAVYEPYLIIFGDFPSNIDYAKFEMDTCSMNGTDPLKPKCPILNEDNQLAFPQWLTIILLCVYLLFANLLLLNLLIAIFNFTFQEVQDNTDKIWKFQRYELIKEYHSRPAAPPPLIIFSHLYLLIRSAVLRKHPIVYKEFSKD